MSYRPLSSLSSPASAFRNINRNYTNNQSHQLTRKHRQSYRHADPRTPAAAAQGRIAARITSNRATVTVFVTLWPWPLSFWPLG